MHLNMIILWLIPFMLQSNFSYHIKKLQNIMFLSVIFDPINFIGIGFPWG